MKKLFLSLFLIFSFAAYALTRPPSIPITAPQTPSSANTPAQAPATIPETIVSQIKRFAGDEREEGDDNGYISHKPIPAIPIPAPTTADQTPASSGKYKNGNYTGNTVAQYYGNVQVQAIISGGKLVDVKFLQYPSHGNSYEVNSYALPILRSEAISAQSANINAVSGASETSPAFISSLNSALKQALL